jgi:N-acetyl-anhydromuramyl-L-alanine amidase AmpD
MVEIQELTGFKPVGKNKKKKQIILTHTSRNIRDYITSLRCRDNGNYKKLPHYIISRGGEVFQILKPDTYSEYMEISSHNKNSIIITLENLGWLKKNPLSSAYVNWIGNIYNDRIIERKWRNHFFWQPYTEMQMNILSKLIVSLCDEFNIPTTSIGHNVKVDNIDRFSGITTKSNYDYDYTDLSPAFNFDEFIKKIEHEQSVR